MICDTCKKEFKGFRKTQLYCSKVCCVKMHSNYARPRDFNDMDRSSYIKQGREDARRIRECDVDCLIKELGDLE